MKTNSKNTPHAKNKLKCQLCMKTIAKSIYPVQCINCLGNFHKKCSSKNLNQNVFVCNQCTIQELPLSNLSNDKFLCTVNALDNVVSDNLNILPSFSIKSKLDKLPKHIHFQTGDDLSKHISSKYLTPMEFSKIKKTPDNLSVLHINIVSIQKNIDELRQLLTLLDYNFDIIGLSETKIRKNIDPIININMQGYNFEYVSTEAKCGGVGIYIKKSLEYIKRDDLSFSSKEIGETMFLEIIQKQNKNILIGCLYRHHTDLSHFNSSYLEKLMVNINKQNNKPCILMGDFNANLLALDEHKDTEQFYDIISSFSFQPLILQPTRVTSASSTLIDNIFFDQLGIKSSGGNIVTSISDHFPQFALIDMTVNKTDISDSFRRDFKNFNDREFREEINSIPWHNIIDEKTCDEGITLFLNKTEKILDHMAPVRRVKQNKMKNSEKPWITASIIKSVHSKNKIHKQFLKENNLERKKNLHTTFKRKRNILNSVIRDAKKLYYKSFFEENRKSIKKTWQGIKAVININKKMAALQLSLKLKMVLQLTN